MVQSFNIRVGVKGEMKGGSSGGKKRQTEKSKGMTERKSLKLLKVLDEVIHSV